MIEAFRILRTTLIAKIVITLVFWVSLPLVFPECLLGFLFGETPEPTPLYQALVLNTRLMGVTFLALVTAYAFGLRAIVGNQFPYAIVYVGLVSNGGAALLILVAALTGLLTDWPAFPRIVYFVSLSAVTAIAAALAWSLVRARRAREVSP